MTALRKDRADVIQLKRARIEATVDTLGEIEKKIAELEAKAENHRKYLKTLRPGRYDGKTFAVVVYRGQNVTLAPKLVRQYFVRNHLDTRWIDRNSTKTPFTALRVLP